MLEVKGKSILIIGSGWALFAAAALELGSAAREAGLRKKKSVFDVSPNIEGQFEIVYPWGVLHHTGHMWTGVDCAAAIVAPNGTFGFAYTRKHRCPNFAAQKSATTCEHKAEFNSACGLLISPCVAWPG